MQKCASSLGSRLSFLTPSLYPPGDTWGPLVSSVSPTAPADPGREPSAPPLHASDAAEPLPPPSSLSPLNPPSNRALTGLSSLNHHSPPPLLQPPPGPIKATPTTPGAPHTSPRPSLLLSHAENPPHRVPVSFRTTAVARSPRRRPSSGEARAELPVLLSLFCALAGELWCTRAAGGHTPVSAPPRSGTLGPRHRRSMVDRACPAGSPRVSTPLPVGK
jgi:hypothetical protein